MAPDKLAASREDGAIPRTYSVHGTRVSIASDSLEFLTLCDYMLEAFRGASPASDSLSMTLHLQRRRWRQPPQPVRREPGEERLGTHEFRKDLGLTFKSDSYIIRYSDGPDASARATYVVDRRSRVRSILGGMPPWDDLFSIYRLAVEEPLLLHLERRGALLLHASAMASDDRAVVFVGLNGSGKSTLCNALLDRLAYMSDNFVAWDGERILGFPSALRVPRPTGSSPAAVPLVHGRSFVRIDSHRVRSTGIAHSLVFVSLGSATLLEAIPPEEAVLRLLQVQEMTHEFPRHTYLGPLAPPFDLTRLQGLARAVPAFRLVMAAPSEAADRVLGLT